MRTAVVRVDVDPTGALSPEQLTAGVATLRTLAAESGVELVDNNIAAMPRGRREAELLMTGADPEELQCMAITMCANAFGTTPTAGTMTFVSRGPMRTRTVYWPGSV